MNNMTKHKTANHFSVKHRTPKQIRNKDIPELLLKVVLNTQSSSEKSSQIYI